MPTKAPPLGHRIRSSSREWLAWIACAVPTFDRNTFGERPQGRANRHAIAGLTRRTHARVPDRLVLGGYETFDYSSPAFNSVLTGDGWTTGASLGWRLRRKLALRSRRRPGRASSANDIAGTANGQFHRLALAASGWPHRHISWQEFVARNLGARLRAVGAREHLRGQSLGTLQADRDFDPAAPAAALKSATLGLDEHRHPRSLCQASMPTITSRMDEAGRVAGLTTVPLLQGFAGARHRRRQQRNSRGGA